MKLKTKYITIFVLLMAILGCSSSDLKKGYYRITFIDNYIFKEFTLIEVENNDGYYYILSPKGQDSLNSIQGLKKINTKDVLHLNLIRIDSLVIMKPHDLWGKGNIKHFEVNEFVWENDTVKTPLYSSSNIQGLYFVR